MKWFLLLLIPLQLVIAQSDSFFGVTTHFGQFYRSDMDSLNMIRMLDSVKSAGIKFIRDECYWSEVEKARGVYEYPQQIDNYVKAAAERGIGILMLLNYNNPLYAGHSGAGIITDSNRAAFVKYCVETVKRYSKLGVTHYEIWNEPNIPLFWDPAPNAEYYYKLIEAVYPAVKAINSNTVLLACATSPAEGNPSPFISGADFIRQVYNLGGAKYMDGVSFHFYTVDKPVENWYSNNISAIKNIVKDKPLYLTETGYPTSSVWPNVSQQSQALYLSRLYLIGMKDLQMISWYDLKNDGESAEENEHNYGLLNYDLSHKPAFISYKNMIEQIRYKKLDSIYLSNNNYHYIFRNNSGETHVLWNPSQTSQITASFPKGALKLVYALGNTEYIYDKDGIVKIRCLSEPVFISDIDALPEINNLEFIAGEDSLLLGHKTKYEIRGFTKGGAVISIDITAVEWKFSNECAYFDSLGYLNTISAGIGTIIAKFFGKEVKKEIEILPYMNLRELESFNSIQDYKVAFVEMLPPTAVNVTDTNSTDSGSSILIDYNFKYKTKTSHRIVFEKVIKLLGTPDSILIDIFNDGNGHVINFQLEDADHESFGISSKADFLTGKYGWQTIRIPLNAFGDKFTTPAQLNKITIYLIQQNAKSDSIYSGSILLDNLCSVYKSVSNVDGNKNQVTGYTLFQNYPNPFNPVTTISFLTPRESYISLRILNIIGETVKESGVYCEAGQTELNVDMSGFSSGVYFYLLEAWANDKYIFSEVKKMILLK